MAVPFLTSITLNKNEVQNFKICNLPSDPGDLTSGGDFGYFWLNTTDPKILKWWDGTSIRSVLDTSSSISGSQISGNISGNAANVTNIVAVANGGTGTSTGSITGTGELTFAAGGSNQNINLTPSGLLGAVVSSGSISAPDVSTGTLTATGLVLISGATSALSIPDTGATIKTVQTDNIIGNVTDANIKISPAGSGSVNVDTSKIINVVDPTDPQDAATKAYVDSIAQGIKTHQSCLVATTATDGNINLASPGSITIDGVSSSTFASGTTRILVKNQTAAAENGIYIWNGSGSAMTRSTDADTWDELVGAYVFIDTGSNDPGNKDSSWVCTSDPGGTLGTTAVTWALFGRAGSFTQGNGIVISGGSINFATSTAYTEKRIPYCSSETNIEFDENFNWDADTHRLGIGTATPNQALDVNGSVSAWNYYTLATASSIGDSSSNATIQLFGATGSGGTTKTVKILTDASERLSISSTGVFTWSNVVNAGTAMVLDGTGLGIGVSPTYKLDVLATGVIAQFLRDLTVDTGIQIQADNSGSIIKTIGNQGLRFNISGSELVSIDSSGNVGIGVTPSAWASAWKAVQVGAAAGFIGTTDTSNARVTANAYWDTADNRWEYISADYASWYNQVDGVHSWYSAAIGTVNGAITDFASPVATLNSTGLGIGVAPSYALHLLGEFGLQEASAGNGSKLRFIGDATKYNFRIGKQLTASNTFEITPSTIAGGTAFTNPVYTVTNAGVHTFLDGAGSARLTIASTGAATFASTVTAKSTGTGTGQVGVKWTSVLAASGTGSTVTLTHNLGSSDLVATLRQISTKKVVYADITFNDDNNVNITFASSQTLSDFQITLIG